MRRRICGAVGGFLRICQNERRSTFRALIRLPARTSITAEIIDPKRVAFPLRDCLETHHYLLLLSGRDWKNPRAEQSVSHPLQQRRISLPAYDFLVDLARSVGAHRFTGDHLAVDRELEILKSRALRQREHEVCLTDSTATVDVRLGDLVAKYPIDQLHPDIARQPVDSRCDVARD